MSLRARPLHQDSICCAPRTLGCFVPLGWASLFTLTLSMRQGSIWHRYLTLETWGGVLCLSTPVIGFCCWGNLFVEGNCWPFSIERVDLSLHNPIWALSGNGRWLCSTSWAKSFASLGSFSSTSTHQVLSSARHGMYDVECGKLRGGRSKFNVNVDGLGLVVKKKIKIRCFPKWGNHWLELA